tara:strand:- start:4578 stop:5141 length:564 start_codon:yes stop_codon:yes gene_type:complete
MQRSNDLETLSDEEIENMSLPELQAMLEMELQRAEQTLAGGAMPKEPMMEEEALMEEAPMEEAAAPPPEEMDMMEELTPAVIQEATSMLVEAGMLDKAASEITPELRTKLQAAADKIDPGLYDLNDQDQLEEFINGIINGIIELTPTGPEPAPTGLGLGGGPPAPGLPPGAGLGVPSGPPPGAGLGY